jgi:predicted  nucleic acid-binding Zn-ribbon protein
MVAQRTAEQIQWSDDAAKQSTGLWGCWDCGCEESYVKDTDKDAEHVRVRRRQCIRCGAWWETEEHRIAKGSFFGRAESRRYAHFRKSRYAIRRCLMCHEPYRASKYRQHTADSPAHLEALARREARKRKRQRSYARRWMAAKRALLREQKERAA